MRAVVVRFLLAVTALCGAAPDHPLFSVPVRGEGPTALLIPGLACDGAVWSETVDHLQERYRCHVVTLAGFSTQAPVDTSALLNRYREALLAYLATLEGPSVVIGHSLGGFLALSMAIAAPDRIGPVVVVDALPFLSDAYQPGISEDQARAFAKQVRQQMLMVTPEQRGLQQTRILATMISDSARISTALKWYLDSDPVSVAQAYAELVSSDLRPDLARVSSPILVLGSWIAARAIGRTREQMEALYRNRYSGAGAARVVMSDSGRHFLMWDDPVWVRGEIDAFLKRHAGM